MAGLSSLNGASGGGKSYDALRDEYNEFSFPQAEIELGGTVFDDKAGQMLVNDIVVENTCGFEASIARFRIYNVYDAETGQFKYDDIKKFVLLGASMTVKLGYLGVIKTVFVGFVAGINYAFDPLDMPYIEVTGMDVKGIMMANNYAAQLTAKSYGDAVREILEKTSYEKLKTGGAITDIAVTDTPDKQSGGGDKASAATIEMVSESDYEFVVKAAKKFNYEFFVDCGKVLFRKAKCETTPFMTLGVGKGISRFDIGYSLTGMVENIEARAMNPGTGKLISSKSKLSNTLSTSSKAKGLISKSRMVYIDPSISSQEEADTRVSYLMEAMSYRLGALECECVGIPDLTPGKFVTLSGFGVPVDNIFYLTAVTHDFQNDTGYKTKLVGKAAEVKK